MNIIRELPSRREVSEDREQNLAARALLTNNYDCYLPPSGYYNPNRTDKESAYWANWKKRADESMTPQVLAAMHHNLQESGVIPATENNLVMASFGSNIPTHERFFFDLARRNRFGKTYAVAVDHLPISQSIISKMSIGNGLNQETLHYDPRHDTFQYVTSEEEKYHLPDNSIDMIWNFRSSLYYYLRAPFRGAPEVVEMLSIWSKDIIMLSVIPGLLSLTRLIGENLEKLLIRKCIILLENFETN